MPTWEFLLQKKGDESWLPLESPTLEILEGEYRLAAKSSLVNTSTHIQVDYLPSDTSTQSWHRSFHRVTNSQGLLLILPFHHFNGGTWTLKCEVATDVKVLKIQVLEAIATDWDFFDQITEQANAAVPEQQLVNQINKSSLKQLTNELGRPAIAPITEVTDPLTQIELAELELLLIPNLENSRSTSLLPLELITLEQSEFTIKGEATIEIIGEAYLSGEVEIILKDGDHKIIHNHYKHNNSDSDFFNYTITIPEQSETLTLTGEVRICPHQQLDLKNHIVRQIINVECKAVLDPFRKFPVLPFENLPAHEPVRRNIKFPELPEFLTLGRKNKSKAVLANPKKPIPNWEIATPYQIPNFSDNELRFEFE